MHPPAILAALLGTLCTGVLVSGKQQPLQTTITLRISPSALLPNPAVLPPSTHATFSALGTARRAPLTVANTFSFSNITAGSYLVDIHCPTHGFAPLRVDVLDRAGGKPTEDLKVSVWETFRGNDWDNLGEAAGRGADGVWEVKVLGGKGYFMERSSFSVFSILRNPMILLGLVSMGIFIGMPYLVDNMDPEMRAEWEERQKSNPMNGIMGAATGQPGAGSSFDMAAFLAGSTKKDEVSPAPASGNGEGKRKKR